MFRMGFEPTIPVFDRVKTVHALDSAATVIGKHFGPYQDSNSNPSVVQPVVSRYTDCAIPALPSLKLTSHVIWPQ
jgi:hypothetical protein